MRQGDVYETLRRLATRLKDEGLEYAVVGGMALVEHGDRRATEDIDLLMRRETLIELKLPSGLSAPHRTRDLADVQDLIVRAKLPLDLEERLDPSVREEYRRLWQIAQAIPPEE